MGAVLDDHRAVTVWCRRERIWGDGAVAAGRRPDGSLTRAQELELVELIRDRHPDQAGLAGPLWTRRSVATLVREAFAITLPPTEVGRLLESWGVAPASPGDRACVLCAGAVTRWMETDYPDLARTALRHQATLHWVGRTRLCGVEPGAEVVSGVTVRGKVQFMITSTRYGAPLSVDFLERLRGEPARRVHAIVDGSWTRSELPAELPGDVVLHHLPSCARL